MATKYLTNLARALLGQSFDDLTSREQHVIESVASGEPIAENTNQIFRDQTTSWQRLADSLAQVVGSWPFICVFFIFLIAWMGLNSLILTQSQSEFDAYPYILLNLVLSTLASIQAPIIMMSQNRQVEKDRISSSNAFEVNLKIELAIQHLHGKVDKLVGQD
ncbi:MAG: putative membrane protein [Limisphaerales bacterium]